MPSEPLNSESFIPTSVYMFTAPFFGFILEEGQGRYKQPLLRPGANPDLIAMIAKKGVAIMDDKRIDQLNIRVTPELTQILTEEAKKLDWSKTKLAEKILMDWAKNDTKTVEPLTL